MLLRAPTALSILLASVVSIPAAADHRGILVQAILAEDEARQIELVKKLSDTDDPLVGQALSAWRQGGLYLHETNDLRVPFLLDAQSDGEGRAKAVRLADGEFIKDAQARALLF